MKQENMQNQTSLVLFSDTFGPPQINPELLMSFGLIPEMQLPPLAGSPMCGGFKLMPSPLPTPLVF